jgi:hypothetical protein
MRYHCETFRFKVGEDIVVNMWFSIIMMKLDPTSPVRRSLTFNFIDDRTQTVIDVILVVDSLSSFQTVNEQRTVRFEKDG